MAEFNLPAGCSQNDYDPVDGFFACFSCGNEGGEFSFDHNGLCRMCAPELCEDRACDICDNE